jgi:lanthanide-dependent methanol dehydrogenase
MSLLAAQMTQWRWFVAAIVGSLVFTLGTLAAANDELLGMQEDASQWVMPNANYSGWNFSPLDEINRENVADLRVEWTFQTGVNDSHEGQPIVIGDTMYLVTPKPNVLYALDLTRQGEVKWAFAPDMPDLEQALAVACCGAQTRGVSYANGKLVFNTLDGQLFGVDAESGEVLWRNQVANLDVAETTTTAPLIVDNHAIIGVAGGEYGVRGWVGAYDLDTGEELWKFYSTGPDEEMGIGERFQPFYPADQVEQPGVSTWYGDSWQRGGGTVWGWWTYDPELNYFYHNTGNCGPWNPDYRRDPATAPDFEGYPNKYCASLLARDATTGELIWAYQLTPQDQWDLDEAGTNVLVDLEINGEMRKTIVKPARNGMFYVFDRETGEILNEPFAFTSVNWNTGFDVETGMPIMNEEMVMYTDQPVENVCPWIAGRNWENDTYSPNTGFIYFTALNQCGDFTAIEQEYEPGATYIAFEFGETRLGPDHDWYRQLMAVDPATGEIVWSEPETTLIGDPFWSKPVMATAGDLLFRGNETGEFEARDAFTGEVLWSFRTGSDFRNSPITYIGPDGRQYIAVIGSGAPGTQAVAADAPADATARYRRSSATLYVFSVP